MKKIFVLGLVAVALSAGLMLASCSKCPGDGKCDYADILTGKGWCDNASNQSGTKNDCFGKITVGTTLKCKC